MNIYLGASQCSKVGLKNKANCLAGTGIKNSRICNKVRVNEVTM